MKKISIVSAVSLAFLLTSSTVAFLTRGIWNGLWPYLITGVLLLIISGVVALFAKYLIPLNVFCSLTSAVAMGFLIRAWYILRGLENGMPTMILVSLAAVAYIWVFFLLSRIPVFRTHRTAYKIFFASYVLVSLAIYIAVVFTTKTNFVSTFGYYMTIELAFLFAMSLESESAAELIRNVTLSTYSIFVVVIIAAALAAMGALGGGDCDCDGDGICDCCDCCDGVSCGGDSSGESKKKSRRGGFGAP